jgi:hypothetical protein
VLGARCCKVPAVASARRRGTRGAASIVRRHRLKQTIDVGRRAVAVPYAPLRAFSGLQAKNSLQNGAFSHLVPG